MRWKLSIWILMTVFVSRAQNHFMSPGTTGFQVMTDLHRFHYRAAKEKIESEKALLPAGEYHFLKVNYFWWMMVATPGASAYRDSLMAEMDSTDYALRHAKLTNNDDYYIRLMNYGFRYRLAFKEERMLDGLIYANRTARNIKYALKHAEESPFLKLTAAIYLFTTAYGEEHYWYLKPYFLTIPKGDKKKGLQYLDELSRHPNRVVAQEATYVALRIYKDMLNNNRKALELAEQLVKDNPANLFYRAILIRLKNNLHEPIDAEVAVYRRYWQQMDFADEAMKNFYADWKNIP